MIKCLVIFCLFILVSCGKDPDVSKNTDYVIQGNDFPINFSQDCTLCTSTPGVWTLRWNVNDNHKISGSFSGMWGILYFDGKVENDEYRMQIRNLSNLYQGITTINFYIEVTDVVSTGNSVPVEYEFYSYTSLIGDDITYGTVKKIKGEVD